ncbi:MBL fold metallo-hydrolase [Massilia horti]|uniref:MBL fold metallo-hydrolase n=1 Tax=Massilia horti TaxID=2562153 RepID=A0A4Y9T528_9BURK|nr:MBL fold metallo-hydrolase [Massilia horti]TFW34987.1 MBL fold metallo-hydrolase [Massilia horti]
MIKPLKKAFFAAALAAAVIAPTQAAAPMAKHPAPGYYRMMLGDFEVTPISDGTVDLPVDQLLQVKAETTKAALANHYLKLPVETSANAFLINTGSKLVLVDTGAGVLFGPTLGKFVNNLKAAGYKPEQIDEIYITHFHGDHVGGLVSDGKIAFPNAIVRADKRESEFWLSEENLNKAAQDKKDDFKGAQATLNPYVKAGKFKPFDGDAQLLPGVSAHAAHGHTPGHTVYVVESRGQKLMLIGDMIHVAAVQMENPQVTIAFDSDEKAARSTRLKEFDAAAKGGYLVGAAHLQFPGLGHLRSEGKGYRWVPVNYTQMR